MTQVRVTKDAKKRWMIPDPFHFEDFDLRVESGLEMGSKTIKLFRPPKNALILSIFYTLQSYLRHQKHYECYKTRCFSSMMQK
uniref:AlNc14C229G9266 protein n=1 Tax=Albugo laibachii Nc14 TaxID=890382 RepID=F0WSC6_9STRA|nr:AlNc14C229G9266 [Albugo laibachii Nc14]CCA25883.1 AlNc14C329G10670 [Albugo laibachii Nc14]|eukprot:CCA25883.1 AlNc14C329G10670 [Albugo laibachii Nc14]